MATLNLHNASKAFGKKEVLKNVSFHLKTGDLIGLYGRNGCGKSTLLKMIFGTLKGKIEMSINDQKISAKNVIASGDIGYLPQHPFLPKNVKVRDVIPIYFSAQEKQDVIFYDTIIKTFTHKKVGELSLGQLKYFEVILVGSLSHPFLLLDEPFSMLEPLQKAALKKFLLQKKAQKGILITDHYYNDVFDICDKHVLLKDGALHPIESLEALQQYGYLNNANN